jgi:hypothetical protein
VVNEKIKLNIFFKNLQINENIENDLLNKILLDNKDLNIENVYNEYEEKTMNEGNNGLKTINDEKLNKEIEEEENEMNNNYSYNLIECLLKSIKSNKMVKSLNYHLIMRLFLILINSKNSTKLELSENHLKLLIVS